MPPAATSLHPGFLPYRCLRDRLLGLPGGQWMACCSLLAGKRDLRSAAGAPISFVAGGGAPGALAYESAILLRGRVACRTEGRGAVHDLHNALVWLTFPKIKATLNRLHLEEVDSGVTARRSPEGERAGQSKGRGRVRDAVTLLDESGLLWFSNSSLLDEQLRARDWRGLLISNRERLRTAVLPIIIGHGLLEKLGTPYKSMTAHCLVCNGCWTADGSADWVDLDAAAAARIAALFAKGAPALAPLPVMGLPEWDPANVDPSYYDDARVFRP